MKEPKYQFRAMLVDLDAPDGEKIVDERTIHAVSELGARRSASEWYNRPRPFEQRLLPAMPGQDWQFVGSFEDNKHFRHTPSGLILTVIPVGSAESDETVGEMKTFGIAQ